MEFVSANPTGPLHIGNARGAFVGDLLCRVLEAAGHEVTREYYFNDFGAQVRNLGASVVAIRRGTEIPEDGYRGAYVGELASEMPDGVWSTVEAGEASGADPAVVVGQWASERVRAGIEASLATLGVHFDVWKSESSLYREGWVDRAVERLRASGHLFEQDGALWFRSTDFGDDKDRVRPQVERRLDLLRLRHRLRRREVQPGLRPSRLRLGRRPPRDGGPAAQRRRGDGLRPRGGPDDPLAWVRFVRDGVEVSMSKRAGEFITLDELLGEIGVDAARWFFAARGHTSGIDFDIELAKKQSNDNPVYYVQYAHARIASIVRKAAEAGLEPGAGVAPGSLGGDGSTPEGALVRVLARFPEVVEDAAAAEETQGVTAFATELAAQFHAFYRDARVVDPEDPERSRSRLALVRAAQLTLAGALGLLGISAPESM